MTTRRPISPMQRLAIFEKAGGICHLCERKIRAGEAWDVSHDRPLGLLGADDDTNRKPAHRACHAIQTREVDIPAIAKAKRIAAKHLGIRKSGRPFPGSKGSKFRKRMDGTTELRNGR